MMRSQIAKNTLLLAGAVLLCCQSIPAAAAGGVVTARALSIRTHLTGFARVAPVVLVRIKSAATGIVTGLHLLPGDTITAGEVLGSLTGPAATERLAEGKAAVTGARAALEAARKILAAEREKAAAQLATWNAVYRAEADLAAARTNFETARARLDAIRAKNRLTAQVGGTVLRLTAGNGEAVAAGRPILTIRPTGALWLTARYYGTDGAAVRVAMKGRFLPADRSVAIPVVVRAIPGATNPDGSLEIDLQATDPAPGWHDGDTGSVTLDGALRRFVAVPTRALILDRVSWWVMVRTASGESRRQVVPGPSRGAWTLIAKGLEPGEAVVVENAYLEFHREFSKHYQQPD